MFELMARIICFKTLYPRLLRRFNDKSSVYRVEVLVDLVVSMVSPIDFLIRRRVPDANVLFG